MFQSAKIEKQYWDNNLTKFAGHGVVRLPPHYCIFNPIEMVWAALKKETTHLHRSLPKWLSLYERWSELTFDRNAVSMSKKKILLLTPAIEPFIIRVEDEVDIEDYDDPDDDLKFGGLDLHS